MCLPDLSSRSFLNGGGRGYAPFVSRQFTLCAAPSNTSFSTASCSNKRRFSFDIFENFYILVFHKAKDSRQFQVVEYRPYRGEKRIHGASQDRSAMARGVVRRFFRRKILLTSEFSVICFKSISERLLLKVVLFVQKIYGNIKRKEG